tara:strand:+ start:2258 stop:3154 length:897 start_codon:yes stop_codon:yes gene_type:complete
MATFNNISITPRFSRPGPNSNLLLEFQYLKGGAYYDPYVIQSVHIFRDTHGTADNILDLAAGSTNYGLVASANTLSATMLFQGSDDEADFTLSGDASGQSLAIFKRSTGKYGVVLREGMVWTNPVNSSATTYTNATTGKYWDIWTVKDVVGGTFSTFIHSFHLHTQSVITLTEPLLITTSQKLVQKYINKNSKIDLHVRSEHTINNTNITEEVKNIFDQTVMDSAAVRIIHLKDDTSTGTGYTEIVPWTSTGVIVNSDDTIIYNWDTSAANVGMYELQTSSTFLGQTIMSDKFNLVVR